MSEIDELKEKLEEAKELVAVLCDLVPSRKWNDKLMLILDKKTGEDMPLLDYVKLKVNKAFGLKMEVNGK